MVEIVIYVALLGVVAVFASNFMIHVADSYQRSRAEREVLANARLLAEAVSRSVAEAREIYSPTSRFNDSGGQLSLVTATNPPAEHETAYEDFYLDNGRLYNRKEGGGEIPLSASSVRVTKFYLERIGQALGREAVKMTIEVSSAGSKFPTAATLQATKAIRGNY